MNTQNHNNFEKELVTRSLAGDRQAFRQLVEHTEHLVAHIVAGLVASKEDRKDLAQDIYLKVFLHLHTFRYQAKLTTWIARIAYNTCIHYLQKKKIPIAGQIEMLTEESNSFDKDPLQAISAKQLKDILQQGIDRLSPLYRTLVTLYHKEAFSLGEICQVTGLPEGTVKNYLFRARKALQQYILTHYKKEAL